MKKKKKTKKKKGKSHRNPYLKRSLIVFIRNPELGKVKTRLAESIGPRRTLEIYKRLLDHTRVITTNVKANRYLFYYQTIKEDDWSTDLYTKTLQSEGDLGVKMNNAFEVALAHSGKAIIIGSDCAQLSTDIINQAYAHLEDHDIVIGPALDGGYYLLGMKSMQPSLFENMTWSTFTVFEETIERINLQNLSYATLDTLSDIDYIEDWERYGLDVID